MINESSLLGERYKEAGSSIDTYILTRCNSYEDIVSPLFVGWEVTSRCNLNCCHCRAANNDSKVKQRELSTAECKLIIDQLRDQQVYVVGITGGEPFARHDIIELIQYCKDCGLQLIIYTNATLINDIKARALKRCLDKNDIIHVSLDSSIAEIHNSIRGSNCYDKTINGLRYLSDQELTIRLNVVPTSINKDTIWGLIDIAEKYNVKYLSGSPLMTIGRGKNAALVPEPKEMYELEQRIHERMKNSGVEFEGGISGALCTMYEHRCEVIKSFPQRTAPVKRICDAGTRKLFIDAIGNCYPCSLFAMDSKFCIGNITTTSLYELWHSKRLSVFKHGIERNDLICKDCELWSVCGGGCMALSWAHFSSFEIPDPRCKRVQQFFK